MIPACDRRSDRIYHS